MAFQCSTDINPLSSKWNILHKNVVIYRPCIFRMTPRIVAKPNMNKQTRKSKNSQFSLIWWLLLRVEKGKIQRKNLDLHILILVRNVSTDNFSATTTNQHATHSQQSDEFQNGSNFKHLFAIPFETV